MVQIHDKNIVQNMVHGGEFEPTGSLVVKTSINIVTKSSLLKQETIESLTNSDKALTFEPFTPV